MGKMSAERIVFIETNYEVLQRAFTNSPVTVRYRSKRHVSESGCDSDAVVIFGEKRSGKYVGICFESKDKQFKLWFPNDDVARKFGKSSMQESIPFESMIECSNRIKSVLGI